MERLDAEIKRLKDCHESLNYLNSKEFYLELGRLRKDVKACLNEANRLGSLTLVTKELSSILFEMKISAPRPQVQEVRPQEMISVGDFKPIRLSAHFIKRFKTRMNQRLSRERLIALLAKASWYRASEVRALGIQEDLDGSLYALSEGIIFVFEEAQEELLAKTAYSKRKSNWAQAL